MDKAEKMTKDENEKWLVQHGFELQSGGISEDMLQTDGKAWVRWFENFRIIVKYEDDIHYFLSEGYYYSAYDDKNPLEVGWRKPSAERAVMLCIRDMNRFLTNESGNISQTLAYLTDFLYETVVEKEENGQ